MPDAMFYHLTRGTVESAAPALLERCLGRGWRVTLRAGSEERVEALNAALWTYADDSFLPHGAAADGRAELQPIYLTAGREAPNAPAVLMLADGADFDEGELAGLERLLILFDGRDEGAVTRARAQWKRAAAAGVAAQYWAQSASGGWEKRR